MSKHNRVLTGITTSGTPHLGNYVGAIRPSVVASGKADTDSFYFLANYHALIKHHDPARLAESSKQIAATWLASGLDPERVTFYRQSDIIEIPHIAWLLTCVTAKGLLNRAHAYKAANDKNLAAGEDMDAGITAGLFMYPVLMAADILAFNAQWVPVGRDQIQHIEMARDIAQRFNHIYGDEFFVLPEALIEEDAATLPGLDGRKMSKSYDNTVPLFAGGAKATRQAIMRIVTDSRKPGEAKDPDSSSLYAIYRAFAGEKKAGIFRQQLEDGMGWGDAKKVLCDEVEAELGPKRERYAYLMDHPQEVEDILAAGAIKARALTAPMLERLQAAVGLIPDAAIHADNGHKTKVKKARIVSFKTDRGQFRFRLLDTQGTELAISVAYDDPKEAGLASRQLINSRRALFAQDTGVNGYALKAGEEVLAYFDADADKVLQVKSIKQALATLAKD